MNAGFYFLAAARFSFYRVENEKLEFCWGFQ